MAQVMETKVLETGAFDCALQTFSTLSARDHRGNTRPDRDRGQERRRVAATGESRLSGEAIRSRSTCLHCRTRSSPKRIAVSIPRRTRTGKAALRLASHAESSVASSHLTHPCDGVRFLLEGTELGFEATLWQNCGGRAFSREAA